MDDAKTNYKRTMMMAGDKKVLAEIKKEINRLGFSLELYLQDDASYIKLPIVRADDLMNLIVMLVDGYKHVGFPLIQLRDQLDSAMRELKADSRWRSEYND